LEGSIFKVAYADGLMFVLLKGTGGSTNSMAMSFFPLTTPYTLTSPPSHTVVIPWDIDCEEKPPPTLALQRPPTESSTTCVQ